MSSLNKLQIIGRLGQNPEIRYTQSNTAVATLSVATSQKYTDKNGQKQETTEWHRCIAWDKTAEICEKYLVKGSLVYLEGPIKTREWEDKGGIKRYSTEMTIQRMQMLGSSEKTSQPSQQPATQPAQVEDDDLPF